MPANGRIVHLTFYKCASQWVRDVLTDSEISSVTGFPLSLESADVSGGQWPSQPPGTFAGPIYGASYDDWICNAGEADRAIVVMRDPRDIVVSLVFSLGYSHIPTSITRLLRLPIAAASTDDRLRIGMYILTQWSERMRSWARAAPGGREHLALYRNLIQNPQREFSSICGFLDWDVPPQLLCRVVERHSFAHRTGRNPGEVNPFSHLRNGVSGDWANYFDPELGADFEASMPGLLVDLGFEETNRWYETLPEPFLRESTAKTEPGEVERLLRRTAMLEDQSGELECLRPAAAERLKQIDELTERVHTLERTLAEPDPEAARRLQDVHTLSSVVHQLQEDSARRLEDVHLLTSLVHRLQEQLAAPNPEAERRLRDIHALTATANHLNEMVAEMKHIADEREAAFEAVTGSFSYRYGFRLVSMAGRLFRR